MTEEYISHLSENGGVQSVREHSLNTAAMAGAFSIDALRDVNYLCALLHDIGKYMASFQAHIRGDKGRPEHSLCGAKEAAKLCGKNTPLTLLLQLCIAGHHTGIPDCGVAADTEDMPTLFGRLKRTGEDYSRYAKELSPTPGDVKKFSDFLLQDYVTNGDVVEKFAFLVRYCFSCITDADSLDTRAACGEAEPEKLRCDFKLCLRDLENKFNSFRQETELQKARQRLQEQAFKRIGTDADIFLLDMPTGSGKTLTAVKCALERIAASNGRLKRIIYVIPYNSIIDQTAKQLEELFSGHTDILRHQSSFVYEEQEQYSEDYRLAARYACENWDAGIIVTTAVQFFESLYANRRGKLRKVHNMADSVIILDEAHTLPREYLAPCLRGISYLCRCLNSEALLMTATMPDFRALLERYAVKGLRVTNLIEDTGDYEWFKKCRYADLGTVPDEELIRRASAYPSALVVMNSRRGAAELFRLCPSERKFHLSTYMTAYDREKTIKQINDALTALYRDYPDLSAVPPERRITVVSTSLIEAGVDMDFTAAFRELTGLDSILQTGGRVNREGLRPDGGVFVFRRDGGSLRRLEQEFTEGVLKAFEDVSTPEAVDEYYRRLLDFERDRIEENSISRDCRNISMIPFRTYSENFKIIDDRTVSIAVCRDEKSCALYEKLRATGYINSRQIRKYCCTVYMNEFERLRSQGVLEDYGSGVFFLTNSDYYDEETGIRFEGKDYFV